MSTKSLTPFGITIDGDWNDPPRKYVIFAEDMDAAGERANYLLGNPVTTHDFTEHFLEDQINNAGILLVVEDENRGG
jgi:hypothetical protein